VSYFVQTRWGGSERAPTVERLREILTELERPDPEHPDVWLTHESGWTLSVYESGLLVWENPESTVEPRHQIDVPRETALAMWLELARGDVAALERRSWRTGASPPRSPAEQAQIAPKARENALKIDRRLYDALGPERSSVPCRHVECGRGAIEQSVFCRPHHFENVTRRPCPFGH
jgi:hypothetical protein